MRRLARAKVNLYLHVSGRRPDGYHCLDSLVVFPEFGDQVEVRPARQAALLLDGPFASDLAEVPAESNLAMRAARALLPDPRIEIRITKRVPVGAGLGGGSADAAAVLHLVNERFALNLPLAELQRIGLGLGADVPACLVGAPLFTAGIGEQIEAARGVPALHLVLAWPGTSLGTAAVFRALSAAAGSPARSGGRSAFGAGFTPSLATETNDLEAVAVGLLPVVGAARDAIAVQQGCVWARMSGSGSACFGLFASAHEADAAAIALRAAHQGWWVVATESRGSPA